MGTAVCVGSGPPFDGSSLDSYPWLLLGYGYAAELLLGESHKSLARVSLVLFKGGPALFQVRSGVFSLVTDIYLEDNIEHVWHRRGTYGQSRYGLEGASCVNSSNFHFSYSSFNKNSSLCTAIRSEPNPNVHRIKIRNPIP